MLSRTAGLGLVLLLSACAGTTKNKVLVLESPRSPGLFLGHSVDGDVVVAQSGSGEMLCRREMLTGTHVPRWICRYQEDIDADRERLHSDLSMPRFSPAGVFGPAIAGKSGPGRPTAP